VIRQVIHRFNEMGIPSLDPQWAGGRPCQMSPDDEAVIVSTANTRPMKLVQPFTRWSIRKLAGYLAGNHERHVVLGRERLRQLLRKHEITFQRTKTWKESNDPDREAKLARIEHVTTHFPQRVFAFDEWLSRPGARCRDCSRSVSPGRSPNPPCGSLRSGLSTVSAVRRGWVLSRGWGSCCRGTGIE
jgi:transposase